MKGNIFCFELTIVYLSATIYKDCLQHNRNYVVDLTSQKSELFDLSSVGLSALHGIDPRRIDARMSEDIGESDDVLMHMIIRSCEQMSQIMRKDLFLRHTRRPVKLFHLRPDI